MNAFCGRFNECNWISVDQFHSNNLKSSAFFLSHCHSDHMQGLDGDQFYELIKGKFAVLYCHKISKIFLGSELHHARLLEHIVPKNYNEKFTVTAICDNEERESLLPSSSADVTFLDAQHIPGSIMILFEFHGGFRLLYTGDYRLSKDDWIACDMLKDPYASSGFKRLDALYFDSTFCRKGAENIPSLKQSCALCVKMVKGWLEKDSDNKVLIWCGRFGHELLLKAIWDELHIKCHVTMMKYRIYSKIDFLAECITPIARNTRVHACTAKPTVTEEVFFENKQNVVAKKKNDVSFKQTMSTCWLCRPDHNNVRVIKPSAIWFLRRNKKNVLGYENNRFCRLFYSGHCSVSEMEDAFSLLRPVRAYPNSTDKRSKDFAKKLSMYFRFAQTKEEEGRLMNVSSIHCFLLTIHFINVRSHWYYISLLFMMP
uniref:Protein artemis n=1 Tax=Brugia malayi TaxID=6279 RepID=A0A1I9G1V5_BRUMA|nr:Bm10789, isoform c [Brugia malayi]